MPFDLPRYEHVIRTHLARSADEMLAAGRALLVVREHVPHGDWRDFLSRLGLEPRLAQRMSQAALKFSNASTSTHLIEAAGNKSKLIELLVLDDDQVAELNDGGTVAGITLDDVAAMSVSDLRKALREARADAEANDKLLAEKTTRSTRSRRSATPLLGASRQRSPTNSWWACTPKSKPNWSAWRPPSEASSAKAWRSCARRMSRTVRAMRNARASSPPACALSSNRSAISLPSSACPRTTATRCRPGPGRVRRRRWEPRQCCHRGRAGRRCPCLARCAARA